MQGGAVLVAAVSPSLLRSPLLLLLPLPLHRVIASPKEPTNGNDYAVPDIRDAGLPGVGVLGGNLITRNAIKSQF